MKGIIALLCCMLLQVVNGQNLTDLSYLTEEYYPANFTESGAQKGIAVDLLKEVWKKLGVPEQKIEFVPWSRGYQLALNKPKTVLFSTTRTAEREKLFKWAGPIIVNRLVLIALKESGITLSSVKDAAKYSIGSIRDDAAEQLAIAGGVPEKCFKRVSALQSNIKKLTVKRIDLIAYSEASFFETVAKLKLNPNDFVVVKIIKEMPMSYAFHKSTPDDLISKFQGALDSLEVKRKALTNKYAK